MALSMETILEGARAIHRVNQIEDRRRSLLRQHDSERSALDQEVQEIARLRAELEARAAAHAANQTAVVDRHEHERDASTAEVQEANDAYIRLMERAVADSDKSSEQLAAFFDSQREIMIATGILTDAPAEPVEDAKESPRPPRPERAYRRTRRGTAPEAQPTIPAPPAESAPNEPAPAPASAAPAEADDPAANDAATPGSESPEPVVDAAAASADATVPSPDIAEGPAAGGALRTIAEEGAAIDAEVEALARTPSHVVLTDPPAGRDDGPVLDTFFDDIRRVMPPSLVADPAETPPSDLSLPEADAHPLPADPGPTTPDLADPGPGGAEVDPLGLALPGTPAVDGPAVADQPAGSGGDLDDFDRLQREFGAAGEDVAFDIPEALR